MLRALLLVLIAATAITPATAGFTPAIKGLPPIQTVGVKLPLKLIQVSIGGFNEPASPATEGCPDCWEPPGGSEGDDEPDNDDDEWLDPPYPPPDDEPGDPSTEP